MEAKADEPFGETVAHTLGAAIERLLGNPRSNGVARVQQFAQSLFGERQSKEPTIGDLRYQLLTAFAGAPREAERCGYTQSLMLVHEFHSPRTREERHRRNAADLDAFVERLSRGDIRSIQAGEIHGAYRSVGSPLQTSPVELFIGKVARSVTAANFDPPTNPLP